MPFWWVRMCWTRARPSSELVHPAAARRRQREDDAARVGLQFPFRSERLGRGAPSVAMKWCDTVKAAIMHGPLPPGVTLDVPHSWQPGMPLLCLTDFLAPAPLKRKRVESKTDPAKQAHTRVPDAAKLWFVDFHANHARVHGKTYSATSCDCASSTCAIASESHMIAYGTWTRQLCAWFLQVSVRAESAPVFASHAFVTVTLAANMRGGIWTQSVYEGKTDRERPHGPLFPRQLVSHSPTRWITQDALLDMIDAIDTDMNAFW